ncbi:adenine nucleotide transporter BT1, chloroplastic/mitochondrial [Selaginella moellendorffii]|uniref:adenine nucleotide transporter BT1, chloroplastic/mitochondrial n=1 Tax=Selaginella moellendorffii TaxID=88036 RepID=UPI000D1CFF8F|nr:adenine nucleotide transporter BT1, chloroplastic/mitochondrial [Selaginella moellendorffii]|eukprot:XP_024519837.1 adenine nucleotide transporter BT1, chloroplastic/mitochondrial [Selaginella moellendorffii]
MFCLAHASAATGELVKGSMDRSLKAGSAEFRGIKVEVWQQQGACLECSINSALVDKVFASIRVEEKGMDSFGLWPEFRPQGHATKLVFKWLPLESQALANGHVSSSEPARPDAPTGPSGKRHEELKNFLCGGFAGVVSRTAVAPLDLIKTHLITSHGVHGYHKSATDIFCEIRERDGWLGLFRGNGVNCIRVAPCKAIELCTFEVVKKMLSSQGNPFCGVAAPVAGGAAGMAGTLATYPLELIRTRISLQPHKYTGALQSIVTVVNEEGFSALYAGLTPSILGVFPYAATNYFVYDGLRSAYHRATGKRHVPTGLTLLFGAVAAAASSAVTYPLEVARRQMQLGSVALVARNSTLDVVRQIYADEGFLALYRGLGTTWLKLVPAAGISFVCYEAARRAWELEEQRVIQRRRRK